MVKPKNLCVRPMDMNKEEECWWEEGAGRKGRKNGTTVIA